MRWARSVWQSALPAERAESIRQYGAIGEAKGCCRCYRSLIFLNFPTFVLCLAVKVIVTIAAISRWGIRGTDLFIAKLRHFLQVGWKILGFWRIAL
jgi:hypothetical protein